MKITLAISLLTLAITSGMPDQRVRATLHLNGGEATVVVGGVTLRARVDDDGDIVVPEQEGLTENRGDLVRALVREVIDGRTTDR